MKPIHIFFCLAMSAFFWISCTKDKKSPEWLTGTWELRMQYGGFRPPQEIPAGSGSFFQFSKNRYRKYDQGAVASSGIYEVKKDSINIGDPLVQPGRYEPIDVVYFDSSRSPFTVKTDKETIIVGYGSSAYDGTEYVYKKISGESPF